MNYGLLLTCFHDNRYQPRQQPTETTTRKTDYDQLTTLAAYISLPGNRCCGYQTIDSFVICCAVFVFDSTKAVKKKLQLIIFLPPKCKNDVVKELKQGTIMREKLLIWNTINKCCKLAISSFTATKANHLKLFKLK